MAISRRQFVAGGAALGALAALGRPALIRGAHAAAAWPERPITVVVPFPPGGGVDQMARLIAQAAQRHLPNSTFIVENRPGAGSQIGMEYAFNARPDGYTLCAVTSPAMMTIPYERPVRYRVAEFEYLANVVDDPGGLWVKQDSPIRDLADMLQRAKTTSGGLTLGTTGIGSDDHLLMLELEQAVPGAKFSHVPFNGAAPLQTAVLGGHLDVGCFNVSEGNPGFRDGRFRCLGQAGAQRDPALPEVATLTEQGVEVIAGAQRGIVGPPGMPAEARQALLAAFGAALADPQFRAEAQKVQLPLKPMLGEDYRKAVLGLDARLQQMWSRKPWRDQ